MAITDEQCRQLWYRALEVEIGIAIEVDPSDIHRTKNQLYAVRKELADPTLEALMMFEPEPIDGVAEIWICKKDTELPDV